MRGIVQPLLEDDDACQDEDDRVGKVLEHLPEAVHRVMLRHGRPRRRGHHQAQCHNREHAANMQRRALGEDEGAVAGEQRHRDLRDGVKMDAVDQPQRQHADQHPQHDAANGEADKLNNNNARTEWLAPHDVREHNENDHGSTVVEQRFALNKQRKPLRGAQLTQQGHHSNRIRRRHHRAKRHPGCPVPVVREDVHGDHSSQGRREHDAWHC
mmetsp:Transcript_22297/g.78143  ORF Transcript_22297/g.78143 Transcript_22297/m.78143 type:complete len:212 (+) Transcript_22297:1337-1972(+)